MNPTALWGSLTPRGRSVSKSDALRETSFSGFLCTPGPEVDEIGNIPFSQRFHNRRRPRPWKYREHFCLDIATPVAPSYWYSWRQLSPGPALQEQAGDAVRVIKQVATTQRTYIELSKLLMVGNVIMVIVNLF